jgi:guanylate kinase
MNKLERLAEFKQILAHYHVSEETKKILADTSVMLMLGLSASGRNTIINELLKTGDYYFITSDTTRKKRINNGVHEQNGVEYWFRNEDEVLKDLKDGKFIEAEIIHGQQVSGISIREVEHAREQGKIAVTDIELLGIHNVVKLKPDTIALLILPPSFKVWQERLALRGDMEPTEHRRRLETAIRILEDGLQQDFYTFVVNDEFHHSVKKIGDIVNNGPNNADQAAAKNLIEQLLKDTKRWLHENN